MSSIPAARRRTNAGFSVADTPDAATLPARIAEIDGSEEKAGVATGTMPRPCGCFLPAPQRRRIDRDEKSAQQLPPALPKDLMFGTRFPTAAEVDAVLEQLTPSAAVTPSASESTNKTQDHRLPAFVDRAMMEGTPITYHDDLTRTLDAALVSLLQLLRPNLSPDRLPLSNFHDLALAAKEQVDRRFGAYATGCPMTSEGPHPTLFDRSLQPANAVTRLEYLIYNEALVQPAHTRHSAIPWRDAEQRIIAALIPEYARLHQDDLETIDRAWPAVTEHGRYVQVHPIRCATTTETRTARWRMFQLMLHEYFHTLTHAELLKEARQRGGVERSVLEEGLDDLFTQMVWQQICEEIATDTELRRRIEGDVYPFDASVIPALGVYGQIQQAKNIVTLVGFANVKAAFFLGHTEMLGLGAYTLEMYWQGHRYELPYGVTTTQEVERRTGVNELVIIRKYGGMFFPGALLDLPGVRMHYICQGETQEEVARVHGLTDLDVLTRANPDVDWSQLRKGQAIVIPVQS